VLEEGDKLGELDKLNQLLYHPTQVKKKMAVKPRLVKPE